MLHPHTEAKQITNSWQRCGHHLKFILDDWKKLGNGFSVEISLVKKVEGFSHTRRWATGNSVCLREREYIRPWNWTVRKFSSPKSEKQVGIRSEQQKNMYFSASLSLSLALTYSLPLLPFIPPFHSLFLSLFLSSKFYLYFYKLSMDKFKN